MDLVFQKREKVVGFFMIAILALLLSTVVVIGRGKDWFKSYIVYHTYFSESYNLRENAAVKLFKADVGRVRKIALEEDHVKVTLVVLEEYASRIRTDSVAIVESPTFIGDEYISIRPGSKDMPLIPEDGVILSQAKKSISDILDEFKIEETAKKVVQAVQELSEIAQIMRDPGGPLFTATDNINKTIAHVENIIGDIQAGKGTVGDVLKSRDLLEQILALLKTVGDILDHVAAAASQAPDTVLLVNRNLSSVEDIQADVAAGVKNVRRILEEMESQLTRHIPQMTELTRYGIEEIRESVQSVDKILQSLQQNILIRSNLPPEPGGEPTDAQLRP